jgi:multidrug efflux pump subunit AcrA (membrane-fusion protein)
MAEAMHQAGSAKDEERQSAKVEARNVGIARIQRELARIAVVAANAGEVEEVLAHEGQSIEADSPAVRLRSPGFRVTFEFSRSQAALARRLGFCQVEVEGYLLDCNPAQSAGDETHVAVDLPSVPTVLVGKPAHLARARYRGAVVLPVIALQTSDSRTGVYIVATNARLEMRPVAVAERDDVEAIVVQGLDVGDKVAVEPSLGLRPGMLVGTPNGR